MRRLVIGICILVECGTNLYQVMLNCWKLEPDDRPETNELIQFFEAYKDEMCPYQGKVYLTLTGKRAYSMTHG